MDIHHRIKQAIDRAEQKHKEAEEKKAAGERRKQKEERERADKILPVADDWIDKELPKLIEEAVTKNRKAWQVRLIGQKYRDEYLTDVDLADAAQRVGLQVVVKTGSARYYDDGPLEDYLHHYINFGMKPPNEDPDNFIHDR